MIEGEAEEDEGCPADFACGFCRHKFCQQSLQDHVKIDHLNYFPYKCMQPNCFDHFSSEEIFDLHCDVKHDGEKRIYVQTDPKAEKLCGMILAEHADNPFRRSKKLITEFLDRKFYQHAVYRIYQLNRKWLENLHLPDGSKTAEILRHYLSASVDTDFYDSENLQLLQENPQNFPDKPENLADNPENLATDFKEKGELGLCYVCAVTDKVKRFLRNRENFESYVPRDNADSVPCQEDAAKELRKLMNAKEIGQALLENLKCTQPREHDDHVTQKSKRQRVKRPGRKQVRRKKIVSRPPDESTTTTSKSGRGRSHSTGYKLICKLCGHQSRSNTITQHWRQHLPTETGVDWLFSCSLCSSDQKKLVKSLYLYSIESHLFSAHQLKAPYQVDVHYQSREQEFGHVLMDVRAKCYGK